MFFRTANLHFAVGKKLRKPYALSSFTSERGMLLITAFAKWAGYAIMGVVCLRKELSNMGTFIVALVFAAFLFFILTAGYNEDKTWNL